MIKTNPHGFNRFIENVCNSYNQLYIYIYMLSYNHEQYKNKITSFAHITLHDIQHLKQKTIKNRKS